jgi:TPR repeat protein
MYAEGRGTAKDPQTAYFWISAASAAGDHRGRELQHALEQQLNAKQITEARARVNHLQQATPQVPASSFVQ